MPGILVGVDGSDHSRRALGWAMREAAHHRVPLTVLSVQHAAVRPATRIYWGVPAYPEDGLKLDLARMTVRGFVDKVASEIGETVPDLTVSVATGYPAEELLKASHDADMLVVGSRGSGGFAKLLMGSVSSHVTQHATCPVVVIPDSAQPA